MFEKEAEEIAKDIYIHHFDDDVNYPDVLKAITEGVQKGAEFGYNKANEWSYPSKGEYPKDEFADEYTKSRLPSAYKRFYCLCLGDDYVIGKYIRGLFNTAEGLYSLNEVIAWKEIVLPSEPMRSLNKEEQKNYTEAINKVYKPTGVKLFDKEIK